jgi:polyisoprenoid-binding protein YceI
MSNLTVTSPVRKIDGVEIPAAGTWSIDPSHTHAGFSVRHLMVSKVRGRFAGVSGTVTIAEDPLDSHVEVDIDTASIDTRDEQRDAHLRSPDFFDVENYPTMTYRSTAVRPAGKGRWLVDGELTLHGVTRSVPLEVTFEGAGSDPWGGVRAGFSARAEIDREDYGLTWNQVLETGGIAVGKKVTIDLEVETALQA